MAKLTCARRRVLYNVGVKLFTRWRLVSGCELKRRLSGPVLVRKRNLIALVPRNCVIILFVNVKLGYRTRRRRYRLGPMTLVDVRERVVDPMIVVLCTLSVGKIGGS